MLDSMNASILNIPSDAPAGYASYLTGQQKANSRDFNMARFNFCNAAELGYEAAKAECSKYSIIDAAVEISANNYDLKLAANLVRMKVCDAAKYGNPAKDMCEKLKTAGDQTTIELISNKKYELMNDLSKSSDKSLSIQTEEF